MGDKSFFRETAESITKWIDANKERQRKFEAAEKERIKISGEIKQGSLIESTRDTARDLIAGTGAYFATVGTDHRFLEEYNIRSGVFEEKWKKNISDKLGYEKFGFRMASGWELPKGALYNGQPAPDKEGKKIDALTAVFVSRKNGQIEVLDRHDPRYTDLIVPYLITQLIVPSVAGKAFGALSVIAKGTKAAEVVQVAANTGGKIWGAIDNGSGLVLGATQVSSNFMLKPGAIAYLGRIFDNPKEMTTDKLRETLNTAFQEFSYKNGPLSEQYYVPTIRANENPQTRLQDLGKGILQNIYKVTHPFEKVEQQHFKKEEQITEVRDELARDKYFERGYLKLAAKSLSGAKLNEQENALLLFGTNVMTQLQYEDIPPARLPKILGSALRITRDENMSDADYGKAVIASVDKHLKDVDARIVQYEAFEKSKAMANGMAFSIH